MKSYLRHIGFSLLALLFLTSSYSQGSMMLLKERKKQKLSFENINNLIVIPIKLNGKELSFILDSGARKTILFGSSISDSFVLNDRIRIKIRGLGEGEPIDAIVSKNNRINISGIYGYKQTVYVILNDNFDLSLKMGRPIHGIIGNELLKNFVTSINYQKSQLIFYNPDKFKPPQSKKYQSFPLSFHHDKPYIVAESHLSDSLIFKTKLLLDTGCSDALWLFENNATGLVTQNTFFKDYLGEGLSGSIEGKRSRIKSFKLGAYTFNNMTTAFLDSASTIQARFLKNRDGSIGSRLLERFHVVLDYPNKTLYLKKAKSFKKDFRYNRAGLGLAYHKDAKVLQVTNKQTSKIKVSVHADGRLKNLFEIAYQYELKSLFYAYYIRPDSPAYSAGVKVGDIIKTVNGRAAYTYKLREIINLFYGEKGEIIKMTIDRNGVPFYFEFSLEKLI